MHIRPLSATTPPTSPNRSPISLFLLLLSHKFFSLSNSLKLSLILSLYHILSPSPSQRQPDRPPDRLAAKHDPSRALSTGQPTPAEPHCRSVAPHLSLPSLTLKHSLPLYLSALSTAPPTGDAKIIVLPEPVQSQAAVAVTYPLAYPDARQPRPRPSTFEDVSRIQPHAQASVFCLNFVSKF